MDYTLPNGFVIRGIPEGMSEAEILRYAEYNGLMGPMDAQKAAQEPIQLEDVGEFVGEMGEAAVDNLPALAGAVGAVTGPMLAAAPTGPIGMLAAGAVGAFTFAGAGEVIRQWMEGEESDALQAVGVAATEGAIDVVGGRAFDIFKGAKNLALDALGYGAKDMTKTQILRDLQSKLQRNYDTTLRGSQIDPNARIISGMEAAAEEAIGSRNALGQIAEAQNRYLDDQVEGLLSVSSKLEGETLGVLIKNLVENTRGASSEVFGQAFKELSKKGKKVPVSLQGPRSVAQAWRKNKMAGLTKRMQEKIRLRGAKIPFTSAQIQKSVDDLLALSPNTTFDKAFDKLKDLKNRVTAMRGDPATANDPAVAELTAIVKGFEESLLKSARKSSPETAAMYEKLMKEYQAAQELMYSDVAVRIMKEGNPELIGRSLTQQGQVTPYKEVRKIVQEAKKLGVKQGGDVLKGIRQGFLAKHLASAEGQSMATLAKFKNKLADPDFARTFNELIPQSQKQAIFRLLEEAEILNRGVGGEFSLAVRSAQLAGAQGVAVGGGNAGLLANLVKLITPAKLADAVADPKRAQRMLRMMQTANRYANAPDTMPPEVARGLSLMMAKLAGTMAADANEQELTREQQPEIERLEKLQQQILRGF